jgi:hypothetical protein
VVAKLCEKFPESVTNANAIQDHYVPMLLDSSNFYTVIAVTVVDKFYGSALWYKSLLMRMGNGDLSWSHSQFLNTDWNILCLVLHGIIHLSHMVAQRAHGELVVHKSIIHTDCSDVLLGFSTSSPSAFQTGFPDKTGSLGSYDLRDSFCLGSPLCTYMINDQGVLKKPREAGNVVELATFKCLKRLEMLYWTRRHNIIYTDRAHYGCCRNIFCASYGPYFSMADNNWM